MNLEPNSIFSRQKKKKKKQTQNHILFTFLLKLVDQELVLQPISAKITSKPPT